MTESQVVAAPLSRDVRPRSPVSRPVAAVPLGAVLALFATGLVLYIMDGGAEAPNGRDYTLGILIASLAFGVPGAVLVATRRVTAIGLVALAAGISFGLDAACTGWTLRALHTSGGLPGGNLALWLSVWCWVPGYGLIGTVLLLLLPDGRFADRFRRSVAGLSLVAIAAAAASMALGAYAYSDLPRAFAGRGNPVHDPGVSRALGWGAVLLIPCVIAALVSLITRYRRSPSEQREQLKWIALGGTLTIALLAGAFAAGSNGDVLFALAMVPLPAGVTVAVLRHGLWDVDLVINRSLVYLTLSACALVVYGAVVALVSGTVGGIVAIAIIVLGLHPLHRAVQGTVNRLVYGARDDPAVALRHLGERLVAVATAEEVLPAAAETVARALRLPYVAVELEDGFQGSYGSPAETPVVLPLRYQGSPVGALRVSTRDRGGQLSARDLRALEAISRQIGTAAHAVELSRELRRSRERIVLAREEERRRLRRELHDGLGPTLAALALELEAARELVDRDPRRVDAMLERAASRAGETVGDVRRIVYDLRPPALDDLGLVAAIRERADSLSCGGVEIAVHAPEDLPPLPAAVESAAYRIASEALANVARHAAARTCSVTLACDNDWLTIGVCDDGRGFDPAARPGVGLVSMRERAAELGGAVEVGSAPGGGANLVARLPLVAQ